MGEISLIYGKSGSGKSYALKEFGDEEITLFNVEGKSLPFRKRFRYTVNTDNVGTIMKGLSRMPTKTAVIDDAGYILTNTFMRGHRDKKGSGVYDLYNDLADMYWGLFKFIKTELPEDVIVYILMHEDTNDMGETKLKTIGRLLDDKVCLEGMVTVCLRCVSTMGRHYLKTVTDGTDITKAPPDMFSAEEIDNDLKAVDTAIREYYNFTQEVNNND